MSKGEDYEYRKLMWVFLSGLFHDVNDLDFIWLFSEEDMVEANKLPDGIGSSSCAGVIKGAIS